MSRVTRFLGLLSALIPLLVLGVVLASPARAEFGPIELVSKSADEQAADAVSPAISGDGDYVVFAGELGGREGIFRKDLQTGALTLVVELPGGEAVNLARPSISRDGRYVAFTTKLRLDPTEDPQPGSSDVYVADLSTTPPTYELASIRLGCDPATSEECGLTYEGSEGERLGSEAAGRVAISENGRRVAFLVRAESNLDGTGTPPGQVAVHDLESHRTYLITVKSGTEEPVPGGGAATASEGAAISGDGSTVAWVGRHLPGQVPMLVDEEQKVKAFEPEMPSSPSREYHEPLWRRVPSPLDENPPTRRIVGGGDPPAPECPPGGTLAVAACQGPFPESMAPRARTNLAENEGPGWGLGVPQLDRNGETVAVVGDPDEDDDLFVVNMTPGLGRREAVRRLTQWVNPVPGSPNLTAAFEEKFNYLSGPIGECAISPDGNRIAFTTTRQAFPLAPPTLVTPPPAGTSTSAELYQVDLTAETIERATPGGGAAVSLGGGATSPSYNGNGLLLAFASSAFNLVPGDTNKASDAFVVESPPAASVEDSVISNRPSQISVRPLWRITANVRSLRNGRVLLVVGLPGAGTVRAKAEARLGERLKLRRVASAHHYAGTASLQRLTLRLPRKWRSLARRKGGLNAELDVDFAGPGGKPLSVELDARFLVHGAKGKRK